jgi:hypothetical protein
MRVELTSNRAVENAAIAWVLRIEREAGRDAVDTRGAGAAADASSPPRLIEVKAYGRSARGQDLWLEPRQIEEADRNPDLYIYVVEHVRQGDPVDFTLRVLGGETLRVLLQRRREQRYFTARPRDRRADVLGVPLLPPGPVT